MPTESDSPLDQLWTEYGQVFREFDDLTLARWLAQTLGQLSGKAWRWSHPLIGAYRLAAPVSRSDPVQPSRNGSTRSRNARGCSACSQ